MISKNSLDIEWINKVSAENLKADKILVEKVIQAMLLLEGIAKNKLDFVFKGGTALMLLTDSSKRLSIDIDIILPKSPKNLEEILNQAAAEQGFNKVEFQERNAASKIQKAHYKFFYKPVHNTLAAEESILLDILFEKVNYQNIVTIPIVSKFIIADGTPIQVNVPSKEDFLGDKLTAFAPNTTGIPYFKKEGSMSMEIIKQLYDIGNLFDIAENENIIKSTFKAFATTELSYRNHDKLTYEDVLKDIYETSLCIVSRGVTGSGDFEQLQQGIHRISRFIFSEPYHLEKAIISASKTAYLAVCIKHNVSVIEKYGGPKQMKEWTVKEPLWLRLNRLKKSSPEAFFYWYKIFELTTTENLWDDQQNIT